VHGTTLLRELLRDVVQRDIVSRHALRASRPLMTLALHLLAHTGQPLSLQALAKGLALPSVAQTGRLVEYLQDAWLLLAVPRFSTKFKQRIISPPKYYAVDPGLAAASSPNPTARSRTQARKRRHAASAPPRRSAHLRRHAERLGMRFRHAHPRHPVLRPPHPPKTAPASYGASNKPPHCPAASKASRESC